jgi:hypothetical protein
MVSAAVSSMAAGLPPFHDGRMIAVTSLLLFEIGRYWLLALSVAVFSIGAWLCRTGWTCDKPARFGGIFLLVAAVILLGIFQDVRLDHLCAIHGTCRG